MPLAIRSKDPITGEDQSFHPGRDIAYFYPQLLDLAIQGLMEKNWEPWYGEFLKEHNVDEQTLMDTLRTFSLFCVDMATDPELKTPGEALEAAEFFKKPKAAQVVVMAKLGQLCAGAFWAGIQHQQIFGSSPEPLRMIRRGAERLSAYMTEKWNANTSNQNPTATSVPTGTSAPGETSENRD